MCGICGVYSFSRHAPVGPHLLQAMQQALFHRGPDDDGAYLDDQVGLGLGFRRLSIIDLEGSRQPLFNEDRQIVLTFNGEIYNYRDLQDRLLQHGHRFRTNGDGEVIAHLYEQYGPACVQQLRGMFGFALWDARQRRLLLARDRLGIKPLYYTVQNDTLIYASEIKAILQHPHVARTLNLDALKMYLAMRYVPAPHTMFAGIHALPPGHILLCDATGVRVEQYWDIPFVEQPDTQRSEGDYAEELEALLHEIVQQHLISDVPFGAFLSGGVDSSTIVALMTHFLDEPVQTFSVGFAEPWAAHSELTFAHLVARQYQTRHHDVIIAPHDISDAAAHVIWHLDQPIGDEATVANYMVAKLASQHVKMVLTGEGGDELFAGYGRYQWERRGAALRRMPVALRATALGASRLLHGLRGAKIALYALSHSDEAQRMRNWFPMYNSDMLAALLEGQPLEQHRTQNNAEQMFRSYLDRAGISDPINRMLYVDTRMWLVDDLLARGDKTSMAHSLEARVPFLDHKLVEFAARLPSHLKVNQLQRKYILKKVAERFLPKTIVYRKKQGFPLPMTEWFRAELRPFVHDLLSPERIQQRGFFNPAYVAQLLHEHDTSIADHSLQLWGLVSLELWQQQFLDRAPCVATQPERGMADAARIVRPVADEYAAEQCEGLYERSVGDIL